MDLTQETLLAARDIQKHVVLKDPELNGWQYGMLRSFERAIAEVTGAEFLTVPPYRIIPRYWQHFSLGMRRARYRKFFPKQTFEPAADVTWYILMGPENYRLDVYEGWKEHSGKKILYLYDTFPEQYSLIKKLFSDQTWDLLITSFNDAVPDLEKITGRKWYCVEQAADQSLFQPVSFEERLIHFSSYGRRSGASHELVKDFCKERRLYYDYTMHDARHPVVPAEELYAQYAWHLSHSLFTFSWPVAKTHPSRAGHLSPVTCRWFEAAVSGTMIVGEPPANPVFEQYFGKDLVIPLVSGPDRQSISRQLDVLWERRESAFSRFSTETQRFAEVHSWKARVKKILSLLQSGQFV